MNLSPAKKAPFRAACAFDRATFTIGTEGTDTINVAVVLKDARNKAVTGPLHCEFYLSANADGSTLTPTATTSALAIGTNGVLELITITGKAGKVITTATGTFDINLIQTATPTYYLVIKLPDGSIFVSSAITFA